MAFTQEDLDNIDRALVAYGLGDRLGSVTVGGDTTSFADITLKDLRDLRAMVAGMVSTVPSRSYARNGGRG